MRSVPGLTTESPKRHFKTLSPDGMTPQRQRPTEQTRVDS